MPRSSAHPWLPALALALGVVACSGDDPAVSATDVTATDATTDGSTTSMTTTTTTAATDPTTSTTSTSSSSSSSGETTTSTSDATTSTSDATTTTTSDPTTSTSDPTTTSDTGAACGDGVIDPGEECDGVELGGASCASLGFDGGELACLGTCSFDVSACTLCGNGLVEAGEECDGGDLGGASCGSLGFDGGELACLGTCGFDESGCTTCGNGLVEAGEECDDGNNAPNDGCDPQCKDEPCDPDGVYAIQGQSIAYTCCLGLVSVNVSQFLLSQDGATIASSPSNPVPMTGNGATCPDGQFSNQGVIQGGCTETYSISGTFSDKDTWSGTYEIMFQGADCTCFNGQLGTPCVNQAFPVTAKR